nr:unnamed protein product [Digitaria exilis]
MKIYSETTDSFGGEGATGTESCCNPGLVALRDPPTEFGGEALGIWLKLYQVKAARSIRRGTSRDPLARGELLDRGVYALARAFALRGAPTTRISGKLTLCGQAYGAKQYRMMGIYLQRSWLILLAFATLLSPVYLLAALGAWGQPAELAREAGKGLCVRERLRVRIPLPERLRTIADEELHILNACLVSVRLTDTPDTRRMFYRPDKLFDTRLGPHAMQSGLQQNPDSDQVWHTRLPSKINNTLLCQGMRHGRGATLAAESSAASGGVAPAAPHAVARRRGRGDFESAAGPPFSLSPPFLPLERGAEGGRTPWPACWGGAVYPLTSRTGRGAAGGTGARVEEEVVQVTAADDGGVEEVAHEFEIERKENGEEERDLGQLMTPTSTPWTSSPGSSYLWRRARPRSTLRPLASLAPSRRHGPWHRAPGPMNGTRLEDDAWRMVRPYRNFRAETRKSLVVFIVNGGRPGPNRLRWAALGPGLLINPSTNPTTISVSAPALTGAAHADTVSPAPPVAFTTAPSVPDARADYRAGALPPPAYARRRDRRQGIGTTTSWACPLRHSVQPSPQSPNRQIFSAGVYPIPSPSRLS